MMAINWVKTSLGDLNLGNSSGSLQHNHAAWNGSVCVLVGNNGSGGGNNTSYSSYDFDTWTPHTMPASLDWRAVAWNGTVFCAVGSSSSTAATSPDGATWTSRTLPSFGARSCIAWNGTYFVTLSFTSSGTKAARSTDGISWSEVTIPYGSWNSALAAYNGLFCTVDQNGSEAHTSPDGAVWTSHTISPSLGTTFFLVAGPDGFYAVTGSSSPSLYSSVDGVTWALRRSFGSGLARGFTWTGQYFVFSQETAPPRILYSQDTESWYEGEPFSYSADLLSPAVVSGSLVLFFDFGTGGVVDLFEVSMTPPPPPPPANDSAPIVFDALTSSPETLGDAESAMPSLLAYGQEGVGAYSINLMSRLTSAGAGTTMEASTGAGVVDMPALYTFGSNATVGIVADFSAYGFGVLPPLTAYGIDASVLVPQSGWGVVELPVIAGEGVGGDSKWGDAVVDLPLLRGYAYQESGSYGVAILPPLTSEGIQVAAAPDTRMLLVQSPGVMALTASTTYSVIQGDSINMGSAITGVPVKVLSANVRMTGSPRGFGTFAEGLADEVGFAGSLVAVWQMLIEEGVSLIGDLAGQPTKVARLVDALVASGTVSTHVEGRAALAAAIAINSMTATGWRVSASDQVGMQDAFQAQVIAVAAVLDSIALTDTLSPSMRLTAVINDSLALDDAVSPSLQYLETLGEDVLFFGAIRLGDEEYVGWVLNEGAPSQYTNYPFNGFAQFNGRYYGTADDGLYLLEGDDDDGDPIQARIKTAMMDFGTGVLKRIPDVYVAFLGGSSLVLKVITTGQRGEQQETIYTASVRGGDALHEGRIRIGQGLKSKYWQFELSNVDGAELEIDEMAWRPMTLDRRI